MTGTETEKDVFHPEDLVDILPIYYNRLFPSEPFIKWLTQGKGEAELERREFSFTLDGDIYLRFLAFKDHAEFKEELKKKKPIKIDIGAVYVNSLKDKRITQRTPVERELVIDIDLTDYDDVRTCCQDACVCIKCWKFLSIAVAILDAALRDDFGFQDLLWVFSGRRGIHCWVCDENARTLSGWERGCVAQYLSLSQADSKSSRRVNLNTDKLDPPSRRAVELIEPLFEKVMLVDQEVLDTPKGVEYLLELVTDEKLREKCKEAMANKQDSVKKWKVFCEEVKDHNEKEAKVLRNPGWRRRTTALLIEEVMLHYLYPRLDVNVTTGLNHLLKAPFCIHPKTGFVCVPFNPKVAAKFDPMTVPKINLLLQEVNAFDKDLEGKEGALMPTKEYKKTSMHKSVTVFEEFVYKLAQHSSPSSNEL